MNRHDRRKARKALRGMQLTIELTFRYMRDKERVKETRTFERELEDLPLILFEVGESENIAEMRRGVADFLELTDEEARQITLGHVKQITAAIQAAQAIPNG